jgi:hypothetical protein
MNAVTARSFPWQERLRTRASAPAPLPIIDLIDGIAPVRALKLAEETERFLNFPSCGSGAWPFRVQHGFAGVAGALLTVCCGL